MTGPCLTNDFSRKILTAFTQYSQDNLAIPNQAAGKHYSLARRESRRVIAVTIIRLWPLRKALRLGLQFGSWVSTSSFLFVLLCFSPLILCPRLHDTSDSSSTPIRFNVAGFASRSSSGLEQLGSNIIDRVTFLHTKVCIVVRSQCQ